MKIFTPLYTSYMHCACTNKGTWSTHLMCIMWCHQTTVTPQSLKFSTGQCLVHRLGVLKVLVSRRRRVRLEGWCIRRVSFFCRSSKRTKLPKQRRATQLEEKMDPKHAMKLLCNIKSNLKQLHRLQTSSSLFSNCITLHRFRTVRHPLLQHHAKYSYRLG